MSTDQEWQEWGRRDPYFAVLTNPKFRLEKLTPEAKREFFASGKRTVEYVINTCRRYCDIDFAPKRILDFGCGVGRLSIPFAAFASEVVALDIAESMLEQARVNCDNLQLKNVTLVKSDDTLSGAAGQFDLVHSCLVLQHMEVVRGRNVFSELVQKVAIGGCGVIQVTFAWDKYADLYGEVPPLTSPVVKNDLGGRLKIALREFLGGRTPRKSFEDTAPADPEMQMNYYSLSQLMFILQKAGIKRVHSEFTNHGGALGAFLFFRNETV